MISRIALASAVVLLIARMSAALAQPSVQVFADEDKDWGVPPTKQPRAESPHAPTPKELPGARTIRTMELKALQSASPAPVLIDALTGDGHHTIPGARWLSDAGLGVLSNRQRDQLRLDLQKLTSGRKNTPIVFFCVNSQCWLSYNAGLRAVSLGYTNVYWFRGGIAAWQRAGFELVEATPYNGPGPMK